MKHAATIQKTKTALGYVRVSTEDQDISPDVQREKIKKYCELHSLQLVEVCEDKVSSGVLLEDRKNGSRVFNAQVDAIVAVKLDRLFRNAAECLETTDRWKARKIDLHIIDMGGQAVDTSSPIGRMFLTIVAAFAEMERGLIRERTRNALNHLRQSGKRTGSIPFGKDLVDDHGTLSDNLDEKKLITEMHALRASGHSLRAIATWLGKSGVKTKKGRSVWQAATIKRVLDAHPPP